MRDWLEISSLERRYDGPLPPTASLPADYDAPWSEQLLNRRRWAWRDVRRIGRELARLSRALRRTAAARDCQEWRRLRHELAFALRTWKSYRDWTRETAPTRPAITSPGRNDRPQPTL
jgi:hypothetical protein